LARPLVGTVGGAFVGTPGRATHPPHDHNKGCCPYLSLKLWEREIGGFREKR
jgi:hypothetical protein